MLYYNDPTQIIGRGNSSAQGGSDEEGRSENSSVEKVMGERGND